MPAATTISSSPGSARSIWVIAAFAAIFFAFNAFHRMTLTSSPLHISGMDEYLNFDTYQYDAFGNDVAASGVTSNAYRFAGEQFDGDLGRYFSRARYYQENLGRFLGADAVEALIGNDRCVLDRYLYASNDPVFRIDPSGNVDFTI